MVRSFSRVGVSVARRNALDLPRALAFGAGIVVLFQHFHTSNPAAGTVIAPLEGKAKALWQADGWNTDFFTFNFPASYSHH